MISTKIKLGLAVIAVGVFFSGQSFATDTVDCPVGLVSGLSLDDEFGAGAAEATRCIKKRKKIKVVYQVNKQCKNAACTKPYAIGNMTNAINDYEITSGIARGDYEIVAVVHSGGFSLVLNNDAANPHAKSNPFQSKVEDLMAKGVQIYFCQNTARSKGVVLDQMIPGIKFVTAGVTAIADFQSIDFSYVQP
ncbi:MAG: DsrE family protein [Thiohalomonadales bacterium]